MDHVDGRFVAWHEDTNGKTIGKSMENRCWEAASGPRQFEHVSRNCTESHRLTDAARVRSKVFTTALLSSRKSQEWSQLISLRTGSCALPSYNQMLSSAVEHHA